MGPTGVSVSLLVGWSIAAAHAADPDPRCAAPADPEVLAGCLAAADAATFERLSPAAEAALGGPGRPVVLEALGAAAIAGPSEVRASAVALLTRRGVLSADGAARLPSIGPAVVQVQRVLGTLPGWPDPRQPGSTFSCVFTGESRPGAVTVSCTAHACAARCVAHSFEGAFEIDAAGWHLIRSQARAEDDGSCGCCR